MRGAFRAARSTVSWIAVWAAFLFGAPFVIAAGYALPRDALFRIVRAWCRIMLRAAGIRVVVDGRFPAKDRSPIIVVAPHVNLFDPLVLGVALPRPIAGVELEIHFRWPLYGRIIRRLGHIPISHATPHRSRASLAEAERRLRAGDSLVILPEGHRTRTGIRGEFGLWAFRLAAQTGIPVVPLAFDGAWERHPTGTWHLSPGIWRVRILAPIAPTGTDRASAELLRDATARAIDVAVARP